MGFVEAVQKVFSQYADFNGRARRSEYWWWVLAYMIVYVILSVLTSMADIFGILALIFMLGVIVPTLAVGVRRLHDIDKSGWWILLGLIPLIGLVLIYFFVQRGTDGPNQYGPDPLGVGDTFS